MKTESCVCKECGAKIVEYKHGFAESLAVGFRKLCAAGGIAHLRDLGLTYVERENFQKLRYWGLVTNSEHDDDLETGEWCLTPFGINFKSGLAPVHKYVWTYRGEAVRFEGPMVALSDAHERASKRKPEYAAEAVPHA